MLYRYFSIYTLKITSFSYKENSNIILTLKHIFAIQNLLYIVFAFFLLGCKNEDSLEIPEFFYDEQIATEVLADFIDDDIEKLVLNHLYSFFLEAKKGGTIQTHIDYNRFVGRNGCESLTYDGSKGELKLDFGSGCVGPDGKLRSGIIKANLSLLKNEIWNKIEISLNSYSMSNIPVQGERLIFNDSLTSSPYLNLTSIINNGALSFSDGTNYSYQSQREIWNRGSGGPGTWFNFYVEFQKEGVNRDNENFTSFSIGSINSTSSCYYLKIGQPTQGILAITKNDETIQINFGYHRYGQSSCNSFISVLFENGQKLEMDLKDLVINN